MFFMVFFGFLVRVSLVLFFLVNFLYWVMNLLCG